LDKEKSLDQIPQLLPGNFLEEDRMFLIIVEQFSPNGISLKEGNTIAREFIL
jgi:hypothetical protein